MPVELMKSRDLLRLSSGNSVTKRNLFDLIQYSKVEGSEYWEGDGGQIWNTPQQGINWLGRAPSCDAVVIKTRLGSYAHDGWVEEKEDSYRYSFKAVKGAISYSEKANAVLVNQPLYAYPVLLFIESGNSWIYQGFFEVTQVFDNYVILGRHRHFALQLEAHAEAQSSYTEGDRKYVTHLMAERNRLIVAKIKDVPNCPCDICGVGLVDRYGVECIEAHHKTPISTYSSSHIVGREDFALLCPNCHRAVHQYMKKRGLEYLQIKEMIRANFAALGHSTLVGLAAR